MILWSYVILWSYRILGSPPVAGSLLPVAGSARPSLGPLSPPAPSGPRDLATYGSGLVACEHSFQPLGEWSAPFPGPFPGEPLPSLRVLLDGPERFVELFLPRLSILGVQGPFYHW